MFWMIFLLPMALTAPITIYNNSRFEPVHSHFILDYFYSISSLINCACACSREPMCLTAFYDGANQTCKFFFAQLNQGTLFLVVRNRRNTVLAFDNKTLPTPSKLTNRSETPFSIWNTTAGSDSTLVTSSSLLPNIISSDEPANLFDGSYSTTYSNSEGCTLLGGLLTPAACGAGSGIFLTLQRGPSLLVAFRIGTSSSSASYDPLTATIEGSNQSGNLLNQGSSWTLLYNGTTGLDIDPGRNRPGLTNSITMNSKIFSSYRVLITSKRGNGSSVQYSELELLGY